MGRNAIETVLGAVVLMVAALFMVFAYSSADLRKVEGYTVDAFFPQVDALKDGSDVKINGVKVGSVSGMKLITEPGANQYLVDVKMTILPSVKLPTDTMAMVASESLLGGKYMSLEVGVEEDLIKTDGTGRITRTQAPMRLDDLIGQVIYGSKKSEGNQPNTAAPVPPPAAPAPLTPLPAPLAAPAAEAPPAPVPVPTTVIAPPPVPTGAPIFPEKSSGPASAEPAHP